MQIFLWAPHTANDRNTFQEEQHPGDMKFIAWGYLGFEVKIG